MEKTIQDILNTINNAVASFQETIPGIQDLIFSELQPIIKQLEIKNGTILNNLSNIKLIGGLKNTLEKIVITAQYSSAVNDFIESFDAVSNLNQQYFKQFNQAFTPSETLPVLKELTIESTINDLVGQGLNVAVIDPIRDIMRQNITTGGSYADFQEQLRNFILTNDTGEGALESHTKQITIDAINQYSAQYHDAIATDLNYNWSQYLGSLLTTSRELCIQLVAKRWIHKDELPEIIAGNIDGHQCKLSKSTGLPLGMIPDTTASNFNIYRGGYTCGHQEFRCPDFVVPEAVRKAFENKKKLKAQA